jgi:hypothetical protein
MAVLTLLVGRSIEMGNRGDYVTVRRPTISAANPWAICRTSKTLRVASGLGMTTNRTPGIPREAARAWAARVKALVITLTDGTPMASVATASWRPHAVQDPQSTTPWMMASHWADSESRVSCAQAAL